MKLWKPASLLMALVISALPSMPAWAETYEVKLLNRDETGPYPFVPEFLKIKPGDKVTFKLVTTGHAPASIEAMMPASAKPFRTKINQGITVEFTEKGLYGIKCIPHFSMGSVMILQVGDEASLDDLKISSDVPPISQKRFKDIIARAKAAGAK